MTSSLSSLAQVLSTRLFWKDWNGSQGNLRITSSGEVSSSPTATLGSSWTKLRRGKSSSSTLAEVPAVTPCTLATSYPSSSPSGCRRPSTCPWSSSLLTTKSSCGRI